MKRATKRLVEEMPQVEDVLNGERSLEVCTGYERIYAELALFFEHPEEHGFDLQRLMHEVEPERLAFVLEVVQQYFTEDTYLMPKDGAMLIREADDFKNQQQFADFLQEYGLNWDRTKLNVYLKRGRVPGPDLVLSGTTYWKRATCEAFAREQLNAR